MSFEVVNAFLDYKWEGPGWWGPFALDVHLGIVRGVVVLSWLILRREMTSEVHVSAELWEWAVVVFC